MSQSTFVTPTYQKYSYCPYLSHLLIMTTLLPVSFFILKYIGLWQPVQWTGWRAHLYTLFSIFSVIILYTDTGSQVVDALETSVTVSDYADHSFILLTMIGICIKMGSILKNRKQIIDLVTALQSGSFQTRNSAEDEVLREFEYIMKWRTILFGIFVQMGTTNLIVRSLIYMAPYRITITKLYLPWDTKTAIGYWTAWLFQAISRWFGGPVNVACDSLVSGVMYRASAQFKILQIRLRDLTKPVASHETKDDDVKQWETKKMMELVEEHLEIIQIISKLNDIFGFVIFMQYCVSSTVLCVTVFVFAQVTKFDGYAAMMITYTGCLYFQVYLLCSAGSEMAYQSSKFASHVYASDWDRLQISTQKSLLLMMMRSHKPLKFTSFNIIELSIDSFSQIVKFSYSAYNVLAHGQ
uniref:Odorant receptor n=1 Tax=Meteorus pulchricornis TaxID=51522 RepID=A0A1S5VFR6_9HYME|nr:olfactory receptor 76 [Meteorus pulchricornis]